jgi:DNA primase
MSLYTADSKDRVRDAVDMLALVSARTELRRAGVDSYFGLCPFHDERTPSFHVRPDAKQYHCFGCQASGDPFTFVMESEGLNFKEALESLAERFGVKLESEGEDPEAARRRARRERLHGLLERTALYYARYLWEAEEAAPAREYLLARGLTQETLRTFRVGYAPGGWDRILKGSRAAGYSDEELLAVGLAQRRRSEPRKLLDRFRERIMFPAADARGRVVGFGARAMRPDQQPKYLNTADGELYHKREVLFAVDFARGPAARSGRMVLAEGYTDVLALHQAGVPNAVGIMGTSLTEEQISELQRLVATLELCLDADRAGQDAMLRAARLAEGRKLELRVVPLPAGTDPAELAERDGPEALRALVERSEPFVAFRVAQVLAQADLGSAEGRDRALAELAPMLGGMEPSLLRDELVRRAAGRLELSEARLLSALGHGPGEVRHGGKGPQAPRAGRGEARRGAPRAAEGQELRAERAFLALCVALPEVGERVLAALDVDGLLTHDLLRRAARHLTGRLAAPLADLPPEDEALAGAVADLVARAGRAPRPGADQLEHAGLMLELARVERRLRRARAERLPEIAILARQREAVRQQVRTVASRIT